MVPLRLFFSSGSASYSAWLLDGRCFRWIPVLLVLVFLNLGFNFSLVAQVSLGGEPLSFRYDLSPKHLPVHVVDFSSEYSVFGLNRSNDHGPMRAGSGIPVDFDVASSGSWTELPNGNKVWQLRVQVPGASALGLVFDEFRLTSDSRLFVHDVEKTFSVGAFSHMNNSFHGTFSTHIVPGNELVVELEVPGDFNIDHTLLQLSIGEIIFIDHGGVFSSDSQQKGLGSSGDCQVNINCPEGDDWQVQKRGVARILLRQGTSWYWCTGTLLNNTRNDATPYFLTSDHCGDESTVEDYNVWQFYFNYERPGCDNVGNPPNHMLTGAAFKSNGSLDGGTDFKLLQLLTMPPAHYNVYFNGWNLSDMGSPSGVGIHHPSGDAKKISTFTDGVTPATWTNAMVQGFWQVFWSETQSGFGVTEGGSSGSPLFDNQGLVAGTLTGGASECGTRSGPDYYGKMSRHWTANGNEPQNQLKHWLDPLDESPGFLLGYDPQGNPYAAPRNITAVVDKDRVSLTWVAPGAAVNPEGWVSYNTNYDRVTWSGPQRATLFRANDFEFVYPASISQVGHLFYEHPEHRWPSPKFHFVIYDADGVTVLYESPELEAEHLKQFVHKLTTPIIVDDDFYLAINPVDGSGHPSSLMQTIEEGGIHSYFGVPGNWRLLADAGSSYELYNAVYIGSGKSISQYALTGHKEEHSRVFAEKGGSPQWFSSVALPADFPVEPGARDAFNSGDYQLSGFRVFRNGLPLADILDAEVSHYIDESVDPGDYRYHVTALYDDGGESDASNTVFVSILEYFAVGFLVKDPGGMPLEGVKIALSPVDHSKASFAFQPLSGAGFEGLPRNQVVIFTNDEGRSAVELAEGTYELRASLDDYSGARSAFEVNKASLEVGVILESPAYELFLDVTPLGGGQAVDITDSAPYAAGSSVKVKALPANKYLFSHWKEEGVNDPLSTEAEYEFDMPAGGLRLLAVFEQDPTDAVDMDPIQRLLIYPNPARDRLFVDVADHLKVNQVQLTDLMGRTVLRMIPGEGSPIELEVSSLPGGIYLLQLITNEGVLTGKVQLIH